VQKLMSVLAVVCVAILAMGTDCGTSSSTTPQASSGVKRQIVRVQTQSDGMTMEQGNIAERLKRDNQPGSVKHLYVISAYSGQVLIYSTVRGKVTSSGKRLSPSTVTTGQISQSGRYAIGQEVSIGGETFITSEVIQDDGTYGSSAEYLFWVDAAGVYHQHYVSGGQILHISDQPIQVKSVVINMEVLKEKEEGK